MASQSRDQIQHAHKRRTLVPIVLGAVLAVVLTTLVTTPARAILGSVSATLSASTAKQGTTQVITGHVGGLPLVGRAYLQQKVLGGWRDIASGALDSSHNFRIALPTWWLGSRTYRVSTSLLKGGLLSSVSPGRTLKVVPRYTPAGLTTQYKYSSSSMSRWNPCEVIGYRVNAAQATSGAVSDVKTAIKRISQATGFRFSYRGSTSGIPSNGGNSWYPSDTQLVIAWARPSQTSLLSMYPGAAGVGASLAGSGYYNGDGTSTKKIFRGMLAINSTQRYRGGFGTGVTRGDILLHELGHTMGLSHTGARSQVMYPYLTDRVARHGKGDLNALTKRGATLGCVTQTSPSSGRLNRTTTTTSGVTLTVIP